MSELEGSSFQEQAPSPPKHLTDYEIEEGMKPVFILFANPNEESELAFQIAADTKICFTVCPDYGRNHPYIIWAQDEFEGIEAISVLMDAFQEINANIKTSIEGKELHLYENRDPLLAEWMEKVRLYHLRRAEVVMREILSKVED